MAKQIIFPEPKKVDYYYLLDDCSDIKINNCYDLMKDSEYRGFATFSNQIEKFMYLKTESVMIALINYPATRFTKHYFKQELEKCIKIGVDEVEFPWRDTYMEWDIKLWRDLVINAISNGIRLRPMLELGIDSPEYVEKSVEYFKEIGLYTVMTSTGLVEETTDINIWKNFEQYFPNIFEIKIGGIQDLYDAAKFLKLNVDLIATTQILSTK